MEPGGVREFQLTKGYVALVDAADFDWLSQWKWRAFVDRGRVCAITNVHTPKGRRSAYLHRTLMQPGPGLVVDHIDGDPLNNRRDNLRVCTRKQNTRNGRKRAAGNDYKGVFAERRYERVKYVARIRADYKLRYIGTFTNEIDAARAYDAAARILHGEFARLNFPDAPQHGALLSDGGR